MFRIAALALYANSFLSCYAQPPLLSLEEKEDESKRGSIFQPSAIRKVGKEPQKESDPLHSIHIEVIYWLHMKGSLEVKPHIQLGK